VNAPDYEIELVGPDGTAQTHLLAHAVEVGRDAEWSVPDGLVSRRHLQLDPIAEGVIVRDLGSANGTRVNGHPLTSPVTISPGDVVAIGSSSLQIRAVLPGGTDSARAPTIAPPPPQPTLGPGTQPPAQTASSQSPSVPPPTQSEPAGPPPQTAPARTAAQSAPAEHAQPSHRPALDQLTAMETDAAVIRYRPGSPAESIAGTVAKDVVRARGRLAGVGSEPWGVRPQVCLVDPFPDPARPGSVVSSGAVVDAERNEIWVVTAADRPSDPPERYLARFFGSALPAGDDLGMLLDGYGLHLALDDEVDERIGDRELPPFDAADDEMAPLMAASFVGYLIEAEGREAFLRLLATARPGGVEAAAREVYGEDLARFERRWRADHARGEVRAQPRAFLRLALRELRPHLPKQLEIAFYMLMGLGFTTIFPFVFRELVDVAIPSGEWSEVGRLLGFLAIVLAVSQLAQLRRSYLSARVSVEVVTSIRTRMFRRLQELSPGWFHRREQGDVLSRFFSDVGQLEAGFSATLRDGVFQLVTLLVSAAVLIALNPLLAAIVLAGVPAVALIYRAMATGALKRSMAVQERSGSLLNVASENYSAQPVVKAFGLEAREMARFDRASGRLVDSSLRLALFGGTFSLSVGSVVGALRLVVLAVGTWFILEGDFTIGGLVAFMGVMGEVLGPVGQLTGVGQQLQESTGALARINEVLEAELDVPDDADGIEMPRPTHEIRLSGVDFSYVPGGDPVLSGVDCVIPVGAKVAFVGPSGAGKSSVLSLLMRFYDPTAGAITVDGTDMREATLASLRRHLGVVFQENFLFDATIRENIRMGRPDASDAEVEAAARAAAIHDTIMALPNGYETLVGERGGRLSGGQRQRVAIARAVIRDPAVLVLDEATSALDPRTERQISATLDEIAQGRTTVSVTHRLASVTGYDCIFVLVDGRLVERGTHDELLALGGTYAALWAEQTGEPMVSAAPPVDVTAALAQVPFLAPLGADDLAALAGRLRPHELSAGQRVPEGAGRLWLVHHGHGRVLVPTGGGTGQAVAELGPGACFGVSALLGDEVGAELEAAGALRLLLLEADDLATLADRVPAVAAALEGGGRPGPQPDGGTVLRATLGPGHQLSVPAGTAPSRATAGSTPLPDVQDIRRTLGPTPRAS
jgi:ABC-type multidrug transport system fused ATPase/permease subunit/pSer/pThr/pTyr-binding forkhead associated (FHA) protein